MTNSGLFNSIYGGISGLYSSLYGGVNHTYQGIYDILFSKDGSFSPVKRTDIRLGELGDESQNVLLFGNLAGIPYWILVLVLLGFLYSYRRDKK